MRIERVSVSTSCACARALLRIRVLRLLLLLLFLRITVLVVTASRGVLAAKTCELWHLHTTANHYSTGEQTAFSHTRPFLDHTFVSNDGVDDADITLHHYLLPYMAVGQLSTSLDRTIGPNHTVAALYALL